MDTVAPGDRVRIEAILLDRLRGVCGEAGLREGDGVKCRSATRALLLVEATDGHIVALPLDRARFIRVSDVAVPSPARP